MAATKHVIFKELSQVHLFKHKRHHLVVLINNMLKELDGSNSKSFIELRVVNDFDDLLVYNGEELRKE